MQIDSNMEKSVFVIGLTGGIASGKSSVCAELQRLGAHIIDADKLGHQAYVPGTEAYKAIVATFGDQIVDNTSGQIDRRKLGGIVFGDASKMKQLTDIVWPEIARLAKIEISRLGSEASAEATSKRFIVLEAAVLIEAGWQSLVDQIWVTSVPPEIAQQRLMKRNNFSAEEALKRINAQMADAERCKHGSVIINNSTDLESALSLVHSEWQKLLQSS